MRRKYNIDGIVIILMTVAMIGVATILLRTETETKIIENWGFTDEQIMAYGPYWFEIPKEENDGLLVDINGLTFEDDPNRVYFIVPKEMDTKKIVIYVRDGYEADYEARRVIDATSESTIIAGKEIKVIKTEMPVLYLETDDEFAEFGKLKREDDKEKICTGELAVSGTNGMTDFILKLRGNGTMYGAPKKPFSLILEEKRNLCNLGSFKSWNLLADYYDPSLMRNYITNYLARETGIKYEPSVSHVVLYVDGDYEGLYLLTTKVKVANNLVDLGEDDWFVCWSSTRPKQILQYESKSWFSDSDLEYPYVDLIYPEKDSKSGKIEKQRFIQEYIDAIEDADSNRFMEYLDVESAARFYIMQEFSANIDATYRSIYSFYDSKTHRLQYAPLWDMDNSLGVNSYKPGYNGEKVTFSEPEGWKIRNLAYYHDWYMHEEFRDTVMKAYFYEGVRDVLYRGIDEYKEECERILPVAEIDYMKYRSDKSNEWETFKDTRSYKEYADKVLNYYIKRLEWMDNQLLLENNGDN